MTYNKLLEKFFLPIGDTFLKTIFINSIKRWRNFDNLSTSEILFRQNKSLKKILLHANRKLLLYNKIKLKGDNPNEWIKKFPVLTKDFLRKYPEKLLTINETKNLFKIYSSGSTGESTYVYMDKQELSSLQALSIHLWELMGYKIGDKVLQTGISPKRTFLKKSKDILFRTYYINAFSLAADDLKKIYYTLKKYKVKKIIGYPSAINIIAKYIIENNLQIKIDVIIGLGDKLFDGYRKNIRKAFGVEIKESYGSSEGFQIGFQVDLKYMYIFSPQTYIEILDDNNIAVKDGELGNVVVTRLDNEKMPLIRYKIGDLAIKLPKENYPKKRKYNFPLLQKVIGRDTDIVKLPNDKYLFVHSFTGIFEYIKEIKQFKIIQKECDSIEVLYVRGKSFNKKVLYKINRKLKKIINHENFKITFTEVKKIPLSKSGKVQILESWLNE
ncbi:phenylacetate-coenzyme A ligase PaaK-like adenylate-forming protein [Lutibacter sp. Hel_I_33_5]|uniref:phenylacetate--CoA ligase family protein n=1 Tax=Lutibacter sp. Hel_I_33_5 TaxID=1566289 RepID=UPI0011AC8222|nr:phenylacetate--CoA ligase family protein [Lutibacter sp. Hel_I_33_5]TVZ54873.1 phenylacetate-coenzyme A ligase PaaK-like adenylate-forming protein [Lutibacter sp. Hel_I_33_5]